MFKIVLYFSTINSPILIMYINLKNVFVLELASISTRDVLPLYADAQHEDKFWLFLVISVKGKTIKGRYFQQTSPLTYTFESNSAHFIKAESILRLDSECDEYFVLPKHDLMADEYSIPLAISKLFEREVDSLLS